MEPRHERIARVALAAGARFGLALAGGYAVAAHGYSNFWRSWQLRACSPAVVFMAVVPWVEDGVDDVRGCPASAAPHSRRDRVFSAPVASVREDSGGVRAGK